MRAPDATRSANFAAGMGFALVTAVGWGLNWPVPKYLKRSSQISVGHSVSHPAVFVVGHKLP